MQQWWMVIRNLLVCPRDTVYLCSLQISQKVAKNAQPTWRTVKSITKFSTSNANFIDINLKNKRFCIHVWFWEEKEILRIEEETVPFASKISTGKLIELFTRIYYLWRMWNAGVKRKSYEYTFVWRSWSHKECQSWFFSIWLKTG